MPLSVKDAGCVCDLCFPHARKYSVRGVSVRAYTRAFARSRARRVPRPSHDRPARYSPVVAEIHPIPIEDLEHRPAEWAPLELGYGQPPTMRQFRHDIVHDEVEVTGPVVTYEKPLRPAP